MVDGLRLGLIQKKLQDIPEREEAPVEKEREPEAPLPGEDMLTDAIGMLEALQDTDPRIEQAISLLREVSGGPEEIPSDTEDEEPGESPARFEQA